VRLRHSLIVDTVLLGVVGALSARVFMFLLNLCTSLFLGHIAGYHAPGLSADSGPTDQIIGPHGLWLVPVVTTLGGLISGLLVYTFAPEAEGHGTDTAVRAFHQAAGFIRNRVAPLKAVASAITIGSGGAAGREGPIALIAAGVGSIYATVMHRPEKERRLLVLIGMASGLAAIFRSPIGTAVFAIEVLYSEMEFDASALLHTMLGSVTAYAVNGLFVGWAPLFAVPAGIGVRGFDDYIWYALLGLLAGPVATLLPVVFYRVRDAFHAIPLPPHVKPAIGGLGVGLIALELPQVLGGGYGWIEKAILGKLALGLLLALVLAKLVAFALTVSSGGSGGVFAPSLFVGAMLGGFLADVFHMTPAAFVVVGMAAVFGGAARVPIATILMVTEMTGGYSLLVPAALAVMLSFLVQVSLSRHLKYKSLYEAQVPGPSFSPAHRAEHVQATLRMIEEGQLPDLDSLGRLKLLSALDAGLRVELPDGAQLVSGVLRAGSECIGRPIQSGYPCAGDSAVKLVAVLRGPKTLAPDLQEPLRAGDRLLMVAAPPAAKAVAQHFEGRGTGS
jgi:CIC family chloride channel protein